MYRYDASEHDVGSTDGRSGQVMMDNMGYDDKPPDPYRRPDVVTDNKPPAAYNPPYPQASRLVSLLPVFTVMHRLCNAYR